MYKLNDFSIFNKDFKFAYLDTETLPNLENKPKKTYGKFGLVQLTTELDLHTCYIFIGGHKDLAEIVQNIINNKIVIGASLHYDLYTLQKHGGTIPSNLQYHDVTQMGRVALRQQLKSFTLDTLAEWALGYDVYHAHGIDKKEMQKTDWSKDNITDKHLRYAALDTLVLPPIIEKLNGLMDSRHHRVYQTDIEAMKTLMGTTGMDFDYEKAIEESDKKIKELPININSSQQKCTYFNLPKILNTTGTKATYRCDKYVLNQMAYGKHPLGSDCIIYPDAFARGLYELGDKEYKAEFNAKAKEMENMDLTIKYSQHCQCSNCVSQRSKAQFILNQMAAGKEREFIDKFKKIRQAGKLINAYYAISTVSGRTAASGDDERVNLQQAPRSLKKYFKAPKGFKLMVSDYSQVELRTMCVYAQDAEMYRIYKNGDDLHQLTKDRLGLSDRTVAKNINFGLGYLMGVGTFYQTLLAKGGIKWEGEDHVFLSRSTIKQFKKGYLDTYKGINALQVQCQKQCKGGRAKGQLYTLLGREVFVSRPSELIADAIQGSAGDVSKIALWLLRSTGTLSNHTYLGGMIHDSFILLYPESYTHHQEQDLAARFAKNLQDAWNYVISFAPTYQDVPMPVEVGVGTTWKEADSNIIYIKD